MGKLNTKKTEPNSYCDRCDDRAILLAMWDCPCGWHMGDISCQKCGVYTHKDPRCKCDV